MIDGTDEKTKEAQLSTTFLGHLMKVISVIKRVATTAAVGASLYLSPSYSQTYVVDTLYITGSSGCVYYSCSVPEIPGHVWVSWGSGGWYSPVSSNGGSYGVNVSNAALTDTQKDTIISLAHKYAEGYKMPCVKPGEPDSAYILRAQLDCRSFVTDKFPPVSRYSPVGLAVTGASAIACKDKVALETDNGLGGIAVCSS